MYMNNYGCDAFYLCNAVYIGIEPVILELGILNIELKAIGVLASEKTAVENHVNNTAPISTCFKLFWGIEGDIILGMNVSQE